MSDKIRFDQIFEVNNQYRFQYEKAQSCYVLLYPEGMVKLNNSAGEILSRLDGRKNVRRLVTELQAAFPDVPDLEKDVVSMLELALDKTWIIPS